MLSTNDFVTIDHLQGKLLIASPKLAGSCFEKAVVYLCKHNSEGSMGLVLNHALPNHKTQQVLKQLNLKNDLNLNTALPVLYLGGPVEMFRGFILHSDEYSTKGTQKLQAGFSLSSSVDALNDIVLGSGPKQSIITLGYAGWSAGQLESEIAQDSWLCTEADEDIIFDTSSISKWEKAAQTIGVTNMLHYSAAVGHA